MDLNASLDISNLILISSSWKIEMNINGYKLKY